MRVSDLPRNRRLATAVAIALAAGSAHAVTITVVSDDDGAAPTACNLRSAIAAINAAAINTQCAGHFSGSFGSNDTILFGSLASSTITLAQGELTVTKPLSITGSGQTIDGNYASGVLHATAALSASDLRIVKGKGAYFGGIYSSSTLHLTGVEMTYNHSPGQGGAVLAFSSQDVRIDQCFIHGNYADGAGGGLGGQNSTMTVSQSTFGDNGSAGSGGAISVNGGSLALNDSVIVANVAPSGGAISSSGSIQVNYSTLSGNMATNGGAFGTSASSSEIVIAHSTVNNNSAQQKGGVLATGTGGKFTVIDSTLSGNTAGTKGGVLYGHKYPNVALTNATISGNSAASGGAFYLTGDGNYGTTMLASSNSIVSANSAATGKDFAGNFQSLTGSNNLFGAAMNTPPFNAGANANLFTDSPGLGPLADNGGPTRTMALLAGGAAINAGSNAAAAALPFDQRGVDFVRVAEGTVDIGAYEYAADRLFANGFEVTL